MMTTCPSEMELLTVEEFAARMRVSRTTVFEWLKTGVMEEGTHFFRIGRIIRFVWDATLFLKRARKAPGRTKSVRPKGTRQLHRPDSPPVNLDYC